MYPGTSDSVKPVVEPCGSDVYVNMLVPSGALSCFELYYVLAIRSVVLIALLSFPCYCHVCFDGWFVDGSLCHDAWSLRHSGQSGQSPLMDSVGG